MLEFSSMAQDFVEATSSLVGGRTINIMDREGIHMTLRTMKDLGIGLLGFNHCSGELLRSMMAEHPELNTVYLGAGDCLFL